MHSICLAAIAAVLLPLSVSAQSPSQDEQAIRKVLAAFPSTWNAHDMDAFGKLFAPDADFVVITGKHLRGRKEIQSYHTDLTAQLYRDSRLAWTPTDIRLIRPDVALAHVATQISYNEGKEKRTSFALIVLTKDSGKWSITSVQNTLTGGSAVTHFAPPEKH